MNLKPAFLNTFGRAGFPRLGHNYFNTSLNVFVISLLGDKLVTISYYDQNVLEFTKEACHAVVVIMNIKVSSD